MTNALNSLKLELEQSDNKSRPVQAGDDQPDDFQMLLRDNATEESTSTLTNISEDGEQENAS